MTAALPPGFIIDGAAQGPPPLPDGFEIDPPNTAADMAKGAGVGLAKGAIGIPGFPGDVLRGLDKAGTYVNDFLRSHGAKFPDRRGGTDDNPFPSSSDIQRGVERFTGKFYEPQTRAGRIAEGAGEFIPGMLTGGPGGLARRAVTGAAAGASSEGAGQVFEGSPWEIPARIAGGLLGGGATSMATAPRTAASAIRAQLPSYVTDQSITQAESLMRDASARGVNLTWPEALSQVTGRPVLNDMQRVLESAKQTRAQMGEFLGDRP